MGVRSLDLQEVKIQATREVVDQMIPQPSHGLLGGKAALYATNRPPSARLPSRGPAVSSCEIQQFRE